MTKVDIEDCAKLYDIDFIIIDDRPSHFFAVYAGNTVIFIKAPYISKKFKCAIDRRTPIGVYVRYFHGKGFIHWLAWKLRRLKWKILINY